MTATSIEEDITISDVVPLSEELRESGMINGQVRLYHVHNPEHYESEPDTFFDRTVMTDGLRNSLLSLRDSLSGDDPRGTHILYGPYGSGKSHHMVTLYHCFESPEHASEWAENEIEGLAEALPDNAVNATVSLQNNQPDNLWEPFFDELDYDGEFDSGYPDMSDIADAVGDRTFAFFVDELEDWFDSLDEEDDLPPNRGFLQALTEATSEPGIDVYFFVSALREESQAYQILDRERTIGVNMNEDVEKEAVLRHRLFEEEERDNELAADIITEYVAAYGDNDYIPDDELVGIEDEMSEAYPFHPRLVDAMENRYYADNQNQATRGMIYLFSQLVLDLHNKRDLISHGDIDAIDYDDDLAPINYERQDACRSDIEGLDEDNHPYGRRVLNTVLLYSLRPSEGEGVGPAGIIMGVYQRGDNISDIRYEIDRLTGEVPHLHRLNGKFAIRTQRNAQAIVQNAATQISEQQAKGKIGEIVSDIFGREAYPSGFTSSDTEDIPDNRELKLVISPVPWTSENIDDVVTNKGSGRQWRNTFVFMQPHDEKSIESGLGLIYKARFIIGAEQLQNNSSLEQGIRDEIKELKEDGETELRTRIRGLYGDILDTDDPTADENPLTMSAEKFVGESDKHNAKRIIEEVAAGGSMLQPTIEQVIETLLERKNNPTLQDIYDHYLRMPKYPIPRDIDSVITAAKNIFEQDEILPFDSDRGFLDTDDVLNADTRIIRGDGVETWDVDKVEAYVREEFTGETRRIQLGRVKQELDKKPHVRFAEEDTFEKAVDRLTDSDEYVIVRGAEILDGYESDAELWAVSDASRVHSSDVVERFREKLQTQDRVDTHEVLINIRQSDSEYLTKNETEAVFREAVLTLLSGDFVLDEPPMYPANLDDQDPTAIFLRPTVTDEAGKEILNQLRSLDAGSSFTAAGIATEVESTDAETLTFLLTNLGVGEEPKYSISETKSDDPTDYQPGYSFQTPSEDRPPFTYSGNDPGGLRKQWRSEEPEGTVTAGHLEFTVDTDEYTPEQFLQVLKTEETTINMKFESEIHAVDVERAIDRVPDSATNIRVKVFFE